MLKKHYEYIVNDITKEQLCKKLLDNVSEYTLKTTFIEDKRGFFGKIKDGEFEIYYMRHLKFDKEFFMATDYYPAVMKGKIEEVDDGVRITYVLTNLRRTKILLYGDCIILLILSFFTMNIQGIIFSPILLLLGWLLGTTVFFLMAKKFEIERFETFWRSIAPGEYKS